MLCARRIAAAAGDMRRCLGAMRGALEMLGEEVAAKGAEEGECEDAQEGGAPPTGAPASTNARGTWHPLDGCTVAKKA